MENGQIEIIGEQTATEPASASQEAAVRMAKIVFFVLVSGIVVFLPFGLLISEEKPAPKNQAAIVTPKPVQPSVPTPQPARPVVTSPQTRPGQPTQAPQAQMDVVNPSVAGVIQPSSGAGTSGASAGMRMIHDMMTSALISVSDCRLITKSLVLPAVNRGGNEICRQGGNIFTWPVSDLCGPRAEDTKFIVRDNGVEDWNMTVECAQFPDCNGPMNAICDKNGCKFSGTCK